MRRPKKFAPEHILLSLDGGPIWNSNIEEEVVAGGIMCAVPCSTQSAFLDII
jgi:hypothetical protein